MRKPAAVRALLYSGDLLAVDLGTFSVKVLSLKSRERSVTVLGWAEREVWKQLSAAQSEEEKTEIYARAVREIMAKHAFKPRNASVSLPGNSVILRFLALAAGYKDAPDAELPPEARALIPFDEPDAIVSKLVLDGGKASPSPRPEMMLIVAQRKTVENGMTVARRGGLRPAVITNDILSLANTWKFFEGDKADETVVLVNIGATSTSVGVFENGLLTASRVLNIAGNAFTRALKREFDVDMEEAEKLKIAQGLIPGAPPDEDPIAARIARALKPALKDMSGEIARTIDVFLERRPSGYPPIRRILLAGGSAKLKGLPDFLAADIGIPVELYRPMVNVAASHGGYGIEALNPALAVSCGLALSNTLLRKSGKPTRVNLVPRRARRSAILRDVSPGFWRLIAGPVLVFAVLCVYGVVAVRFAREEAAMEAKLEAASAAEQAARLKFTVKKKPVAVKRQTDPFAYLGRFTISGVFGGSGGAVVMLNGERGVFVARGGKLFDGNEEEVAGVRSEIRDNFLVLAAGGRRYSIEMPK